MRITAVFPMDIWLLLVIEKESRDDRIEHGDSIEIWDRDGASLGRFEVAGVEMNTDTTSEGLGFRGDVARQLKDVKLEGLRISRIARS